MQGRNTKVLTLLLLFVLFLPWVFCFALFFLRLYFNSAVRLLSEGSTGFVLLRIAPFFLFFFLQRKKIRKDRTAIKGCYGHFCIFWKKRRFHTDVVNDPLRSALLLSHSTFHSSDFLFPFLNAATRTHALFVSNTLSATLPHLLWNAAHSLFSVYKHSVSRAVCFSHSVFYLGNTQQQQPQRAEGARLGLLFIDD